MADRPVESSSAHRSTTDRGRAEPPDAAALAAFDRLLAEVRGDLAASARAAFDRLLAVVRGDLAASAALAAFDRLLAVVRGDLAASAAPPGAA